MSIIQYHGVDVRKVELESSASLYTSEWSWTCHDISAAVSDPSIQYAEFSRNSSSTALRPSAVSIGYPASMFFSKYRGTNLGRTRNHNS